MHQLQLNKRNPLGQTATGAKRKIIILLYKVFN